MALLWVEGFEMEDRIVQEDRKSGKVGRNDPCPCGKNPYKKFKNCCLAEQIEEQNRDVITNMLAEKVKQVVNSLKALIILSTAGILLLSGCKIFKFTHKDNSGNETTVEMMQDDDTTETE